MNAEVIHLPSGPSAPSLAAGDLGSAFRRLASIRLTEPLGTVLREVARIAADVIPDAVDVCVAVMDGRGVVMTGFASSGLAAVLDERQYPIGYGPCLSAALTGRAVLIGDTGYTDEHRDFSLLAHDHGVRQVLALPLFGSSVNAGEMTGSLTVYFADGAVNRTMSETVGQFVQAAAATVSNAVQCVANALLAAQLKEAMASRAVIEQAKGVIMATEKCSPASAFDLLRDASMRSNRKIRDIAASIVAGASR